MAFFKIILTIGFVILSIYTVKVVEGEEKAEWKCLGETVTIPDKFIKWTQECTDEMKKSGNNAARCLEACKYRKFGILVNDDPTFDIKKNDELIDSMVPESARAAIKADSKKCFDAEVSDKIKLSDEDDCKSHEDYQNCAKMAFYTNCNGDEGKD